MSAHASLLALAIGWPLFWWVACLVADRLTGARIDPFGCPCNSRATNVCLVLLTVGTPILWACLVAFHLGRHSGGIA